jgi:NADH:ubiquinone oxidoreductase subunit E
MSNSNNQDNITTQLALIRQQVEMTHKWVQSIDQKMDVVVPKLESHEESIGWLKKGVIGGIAGLLGFVANLVHNILTRNN